jgi:hypothetical protein
MINYWQYFMLTQVYFGTRNAARICMTRSLLGVALSREGPVLTWKLVIKIALRQ